MEIFLNILILVVTFFFMEFIAWFTHKYIMHGFLWYLHKDHHVPKPGPFEKNDAFFLIFAIPSFLLILSGTFNDFDFRFWIGSGIAIYGAAYFFIHDLFIHQRARVLTRTRHPYFRAIRKAHKVHHKYQGKEHGESFGMLLVAPEYFKQAYREYKYLKKDK